MVSFDINLALDIAKYKERYRLLVETAVEVGVPIVSLENVKHEINEIKLHDKMVAPFKCDITCWFKITNPELAAEKLDVDANGNIMESIKDTLNAQVTRKTQEYSNTLLENIAKQDSKYSILSTSSKTVKSQLKEIRKKLSVLEKELSITEDINTLKEFQIFKKFLEDLL